jgi:hypothetical protein
MHQMEDVIGWIDQIGQPSDEESLKILDLNRVTLSHKKELLAEQLALVEQHQYSAEKVFDLNERYGLKDQLS